MSRGGANGADPAAAGNAAASVPLPRTGAGASLVAGTGVLIRDLTLSADNVVQEASRWTRGFRGEPIDVAEADGADVTPFVVTAVDVYTTLIATAGEANGVAALRSSVHQLADQARTVSSDLVGNATKAAADVVETTVKASREAADVTAKTVQEAKAAVETEIAKIIQSGTETVTQELDRLLGSDNSPAATAIKDIVGKAMSDAQVAWHRSLTTTLTEVTKTFDTSNPASPFAVLERRVQEQQAKAHADLTARLDKVQEAVAAASQAADKTAAIAELQSHSPAKGTPYEDRLGDIVEAIASTITATYEHTNNTVGRIKMCKKGDGVVEAATIEPGLPPARVAVEYTTTEKSRNWAAYLTEAEKNRDCQASLGIAQSRSLVPGGELLALVGPNRIVIAFDPDHDDPALIRGALQLLLVEAQRRLAAGRGSDLTVADAKIAQARQQLLAMQQVIKTAITARDNAVKVVTGLEAVHGTLTLLLEQAQGALRTGDVQHPAA